MLVYSLESMLNIVKFERTIKTYKHNIKINNLTIIMFSSYSYCTSFENLIQNIFLSRKKNIEIISHYDLLPQLLHIKKIKNKMIKIRFLNNNSFTYNQQIIYINSIIFKKYIKINSIHTIQPQKHIYYIGCHIRMGDHCMIKNKTCKIHDKKVKSIVSMYNRICAKRNCKLLLSSDSILFISSLKKYIQQIIIYKEKYDILHSSEVSTKKNYSKNFYEKLLGDINILSKSDYLILSSSSTFSLLILYNNKKTTITKSNYIFYEGNKNIYDPLYNEIKKNYKRCSMKMNNN